MKRYYSFIFWCLMMFSSAAFAQLPVNRAGQNTNSTLKSMRGDVRLIVHEEGVLKRYTTDEVIVEFDFSASKVRIFYSKDHLFFGEAIDASQAKQEMQLLVLPITEDFMGYFFSNSFRQTSEIDDQDNQPVGNNFQLITVPVDRNQLTKVEISGHLDCSYFKASQLKQCSKDAIFSVQAYFRVDQMQGK
jgi:hypothetical protein